LKGINMLLTVNAFVSLDGTIQGPAGPEEYDRSFPAERGGWLVPFADQLGGVVDTDWFALADAILLGRTTYQIMQPHWSQVTDPDDPVATVLNIYPKYVVSSTLTPEAATWANTELISDKVFERVAELKQAAGRELQVHGSLKLAKSLHQAGLVDLFRLLVFPVVVGAGRRLFDEATTPTTFKVKSQKPSGSLTALELEPSDYAVGAVLVAEGKDAVVG
jgi:dihydrofolate reductase